MYKFHIDFKKNNLNFLILFVIAIIAYFPLIHFDTKISTGDGNIIFQRYEALRQTIVNFHQWPGINIWNGGGQPLEGTPYVFPLSIKSILTFILGVELGFKFSLLIYLFFAIYGSILLVNYLKLDAKSWIFTLSPLLLVLNIPLALHLKSGHWIFTTYFLLPLLIFYFLNQSQDYYSGLKFGVLFAFIAYDSPNYNLQFCLILFLLIFLIDLVKNKSINYRFFLFSISTILFFNTYQILQILDVSTEFRRISELNFHYSILSILKAYFIPYLDIISAFPAIPGVDSGSCVTSTHEISTYVGPLSFIVMIMGFDKRRIRWYFFLLIFFLIGIGNDNFLYPMYWIKHIPTFDSMLCFSRVRMITYLLFNICLIISINKLFSKFSKKKLWILFLLIIFERLIIILLILNNTFIDFDKVDNFYKIANQFRSTPGEFVNYSALSPFEGTKLNIGILRGGGDPNFPLMRDTPTSNDIQVFGYDENGYLGEFFQSNNSVSVAYWSPNLIRISNVKPLTPLNINLYPSSNWIINGERLFPSSVYSVNSRMVIFPSKDTVIMEYVPKARWLGIKLTCIFLIFFILVLIYYSRNNRIHNPRRQMH